MTWDTLLDYAAYLVRFLSQVGLFIGAVMIIWAGYQYATAVFSGSAPSNDPIKNAIVGILVITFSYALIRIATRMFLS